MALTTQTMTDEQRKSVALEYLKAFDNGGVTSSGGSILDLFANDAQVYFPKWGLATGKDEIGKMFGDVGGDAQVDRPRLLALQLDPHRYGHVRLRGHQPRRAPGWSVAGRQPGVGGRTLVRRVRGARLADPALLHLPRPRLRRPGPRPLPLARRGVRFEYTSHPGRVVFGPGRIGEVAAEVDLLGASRVFLIADGQAKDLADETADRLGSRVAGRWHDVIQHVPVELAERARAAVTESGADSVVCLGGGSSTGLAKAIALSHEIPILAVPTTYAGSEMTTIYGLTGGRHKQTGTSPVVLPRVVVYDPDADDRPAPERHRAERLQRPRPLGRGALRHRLQPRHVGACTRGCTGDFPFAPDGDGRRRPTSTAAATCSTGHICRASPSGRRAPGCITSCATSSAARSTSSTPTPTRPCSPTPSPSTLRPCLTRWPAWLTPSACPAVIRQALCGIWPRRAP